MSKNASFWLTANTANTSRSTQGRIGDREYDSKCNRTGISRNTVRLYLRMSEKEFKGMILITHTHSNLIDTQKGSDEEYSSLIASKFMI